MTPPVLNPATSLQTAQRAAAEAIEESLTPPQRLLVSEWAEAHRHLPETSAEPGPWRNDRTPYLVGIMDACLEPGCERIVFEKCAQIGGSEALNNVVGFYMHHHPSPIIFVHGGEQEARDYSAERIGPMISASPVLRNRVAAAKGKDTALAKDYTGGHLAMVGANAPSKLRSRFRRLAIFDEVDSYPASAGDEGDPVDLVVVRTTTFWDRLIFLNSTPTLEGLSRIEKARDACQEIRIYLVPCPHCNHFQRLKFSQLKWDKDEKGKHLPESAEYLCEACGALISERKKYWMLQNGEWRPHRRPSAEDGDVEDGRDEAFGGTEWIECGPSTHPRSIAFTGFTQLYSPWKKWREVVEAFLIAKDDRMQLQVWVNTALGEVFREAGFQLDAHPLLKRVEVYPSPSKTVPLPDGVLLITVGVDVQATRLELEIVGWGHGYESWSLDFIRIPGDPSLEGGVWDDLDQILARKFLHSSGMVLPIYATAIDSSYMMHEVLRYTSQRLGARVWAIRGVDGEKPVWDRPGQTRMKELKKRVPRWPVGVDTAKTALYSHLRIQIPQEWDGGPLPGYCHFPARSPYDEEYFRQLTSEKVVIRQTARGTLKRQWIRRPGRRAETLDCRVYAFAAHEGAFVSGLRLDQIQAAIDAGGHREKKGRRVRSEGVQVG